MTLFQPIWLILLLPLWLIPTPAGRFLRNNRRLIYALLVLAMAGPAVLRPGSGGTVVLVVDRSHSMPEGSEKLALEYLAALDRLKPDGGKLAVVSFGAKPLVDKAPDAPLFSEWITLHDRDATHLNDALNLGLGLIPSRGSGRLLVFSDGLYTGSSPEAAAARAAALGVPIDYRLQQVTPGADLAIARLDAPQWVSSGEGFMISARIQVPVSGEVDYVLKRGDQVIARGSRSFDAGMRDLVFRDLAGHAGTQTYSLILRGRDDDPNTHNNLAHAMVGIRGNKPVLVVRDSGVSSLAALLTASDLDVVSKLAKDFDWQLGSLSGYSAIILENTPAAAIGRQGLQNLAGWVDETGGGLIITGGKNSYGPGGYYRSPLEEVMPVSMELRVEHRKFSMAMVIAVDRSGSMAALTGGRTKMELANLASAEVIDLLSPHDEFGLLAVDSSPHVIIQRGPVERKDYLRSQALSVAPGGGGIFVFQALSTAGSMIDNSAAGARHILLFADAADAEEPGNYQALLDSFRKNKITVSVVGLGTEADYDAALLTEIAELGGGQIYFTQDAESLPRIFAQDTFLMSRSTFIEQETPLTLQPGLLTLTGRSFSEPPMVAGYNLCYIRPHANAGIITSDENKAPLLASWHAGTGRVVCFTGEASGDFAGAFASWDQVGTFYASLARWAAGVDNDLPGGSLVTQSLERGRLKVELHLDPEREQDPFQVTPQLNLLRGGDEPSRTSQQMGWTGPDTLTSYVDLDGDETVLGAVVMDEHSAMLAPARQPYSPEYAPLDLAEGERSLRRIASISGGKLRSRLDQIWQDLPRQPIRIALAPWLLSLALLLMLIEVLERRTALVSASLSRRFAVPEPSSSAERVVSEPVRVKPQPPPASPKTEPEATEPPEAPTEESALGSALAKAKARAKQKTRR